MGKPILRDGMRVGDIVVIFALVASVLLWFSVSFLHPGQAGTAVVITTEDSEKQYPLHEDRTFTVASSGHSLTLLIADGTVSVTSSDCPNGICTATGTISEVGQSIACVPGRVLIKIIENGGASNDGESADLVLP